MNADELYETTMSAENRTLIQLTTETMEQTLALYDKLMGNQPVLRKDFILSNRLSKYSQGEDDTYEEDDDIEE